MPRLRFNAFSMNCVSHIHHGQWTREDSRSMDYTDLDAWIELAQLLDRGKFDALFLADVVGTYAAYGGSRDAAVEEGLQTPVNDPSLLIPAMAAATENLGFAFTQSVLQEQPFNFARRLSTLDHLTKGRVGWNIVTSYLPDAARNLGYGGLPSHEDRYRRAEEYMQVVYKLLEGSWEDDAVIRDVENGIYADPAKIHDIDHRGEFYPDVPGPHLAEPSPQRTPVLFQAGTSEWGRDFAARNAEAIFIIAARPPGRGRRSMTSAAAPPRSAATPRTSSSSRGCRSSSAAPRPRRRRRRRSTTRAPAPAATPRTWAARWASTSPTSTSTRRSARSSSTTPRGSSKASSRPPPTRPRPSATCSPTARSTASSAPQSRSPTGSRSGPTPASAASTFPTT